VTVTATIKKRNPNFGRKGQRRKRNERVSTVFRTKLSPHSIDYRMPCQVIGIGIPFQG